MSEVTTPNMTTIFAGGTTTDELADMANAAHKAAEQAGRAMLQHARDCGETLIAVKDRLPHGDFGAWIETHCVFSARQAQNYMNLARGWDRLQRLAEGWQPKTHGASHFNLDSLSMRQALRILAEESTGKALESKSIFVDQKCPRCRGQLVKTSARYATCPDCLDCRLFGYSGGTNAPAPFERLANTWKEVPEQDRRLFVRLHLDDLTRLGVDVAETFTLKGDA